jgi:hypothetical protein
MKRAVLSFEENARLNAAKLSSKMPEGWRVGMDPFARYAEVGITRALPAPTKEEGGSD